jgi:hypothetical protein
VPVTTFDLDLQSELTEIRIGLNDTLVVEVRDRDLLTVRAAAHDHESSEDACPL